MTRRRRATLAAMLALEACGIDVVGLARNDTAPPDASASVAPSDAGGETGVADSSTDADVAMPKCRGDELEALGRCFYLEPTSLTEDAAAAACRTRGATLITITSQEKETWFVLHANDVDRWIGLVAADNADNERSNFHWVTSEVTSFSHWYDSDPNDKGNCVIIIAGDQHWADRACTQSHASVCERAP